MFSCPDSFIPPADHSLRQFRMGRVVPVNSGRAGDRIRVLGGTAVSIRCARMGELAGLADPKSLRPGAVAPGFCAGSLISPEGARHIAGPMILNALPDSSLQVGG
jgi:hypothetical protein